MSISNLLVPNDYDLFADSLTTNSVITNSFSTGTLTASEVDTNLIRSNPPNTTNIVIAGLTLNTSNELNWPNTTDSSKIVLFRDGTGFQFYGFGVQANTLVYQAPTTTADHVFYAASSPTASVELFRVKGNGGGFILPSVGAAAASQLNYYEIFDDAVEFSGIWAALQNANIGMTRLGNIVTITAFGDVSAAVTGVGVISAETGVVPVRFRPLSNITLAITVLNNSADAFGTLEIAANGNINIYNGPFGSSGGTFTNSGNAGFYAFTVSYVIS